MATTETGSGPRGSAVVNADSISPRILSVRIDPLNFRDVVAAVERYLGEDTLHCIATVNPEFVVTAKEERKFLRILNRSDLNVVDGAGIQLALRIFRGRSCERVTGVDLTWAIAALAATKGCSMYLLGAAPGVACEAARRLRERYPGLRIAGWYAGSPEEEGIVERINACRPDILLVAFGSPNQETFIAGNAGRLNAKVAMGVGGTFDFIAGVVPRAPAWMRRLGLEWLYRLAKQPERLRRILRATVRFPLALVLHELSLRAVSFVIGPPLPWRNSKESGRTTKR